MLFLRIALALLLVWLAGAVYLFAVRDGDRPIKADAIVVLSGGKERLPVGVRLLDQRYAPLLVVSRSPNPRPYERRVCARRERVLCVSARPYSTRGEARMIARLAQTRRWRAVDVVTSRFHVFRAKRMIERCYHGSLAVVAAPNPRLTVIGLNFALESAKIVLHEVERDC